MTGYFIRVQRDGDWQNIEIDQLTDEELGVFFATKRGVEDSQWAIALAKWIRDNVKEGPAQKETPGSPG
jgi:hypothetical protein